MTKESLIKALSGLKVQTGSLCCLGCGHEHNCSIRGCAILREALEQLTHADYKWIGVEDRLPEDPDTNVLVIASGKPRENISLENAYELASYSQDDGWVLEMYPEFEDVKVTHWMPLPESPEGENTNERT